MSQKTDNPLEQPPYIETNTTQETYGIEINPIEHNQQFHQISNQIGKVRDTKGTASLIFALKKMQGDEVPSSQTNKFKISNTSTLKTGRKKFKGCRDEQHLIQVSKNKS